MGAPISPSDRIARRICAGVMGIAGVFFSFYLGALLIQAGNYREYSLALGVLGSLAGISFYVSWHFWRTGHSSATGAGLSPKFFIGFGIYLYVLLLVTLGLNFNHPVGMVAAGLAVGALAIALFQQLMKQRWLRMLQELERRSRQYAASQNAPRALPRPETSAPLKAKEMKPAKRMAAARLAAFYRNPLKARAVLRAHPQEPDPLDRELKAIEQAAAHSAQLQVALRQRQDKRG